MGSPLEIIGRQEEMKKLNELWEHTKEGKGSTILVSGEAGIGKTTLVKSFVERKREKQSLIFLSSTCLHYEHPRPYQPFTEITEELLQMEKDERSEMNLINSALPPVEKLRDVTPDTAKDNIYSTFFDVFQRNATSNRPLFIFIDDLHWADTSSLNLFHYLARNAHKIPILICGAFRPEDLDESHPLNEVLSRLKREKIVESLELDRLTKSDIDELAGDITNRNDEIYEITEGNPLFLKEILETLEERKEQGEVTLPESVKDVVMHRVADLSPSAEKVLKIGAVIGDEFGRRVLEDMIGDTDTFLDGIDELIRRKIIQEKKSQEEEVYEFDHSMIRQAVYEDLGEHSRQVRHREIGKNLEKSPQEDQDLVYDLSRHFHLGNLPKRCLKYSLQAGEKAADIYAHEDAVKFYGYALDSLEKLKDAEKVGFEKDKEDILESMGDIYDISGEFEKALEDYKKAVELIEEDKRRGSLHGKIAGVLREKAEYEESFEHAEKGLSLVNEDDVERCSLLEHKGWAFMSEGDYDEAIEVFEEEKDLAESMGEDEERAQALHDLGSVYLRKGDYDKAEKKLQNTIEIREDIEDLEHLSHSYNNIALLYADKGELERALEYHERSLDISEEIGDKHGIAASLNNTGRIYRDKGELDRALECFERSLDIDEEIGDLNGIALSLNNIAVIYRDRGELDRTIEYFERTLDIGEKIGNKNSVARSLNNIAEIYRDKGELDKSLEYFERALEIREDIGDKLGMISSLSGLTETFLEKGDIEEAEADAERAHQIAADMGAKGKEVLAHRVLGKVYTEQERWKKAEDEFKSGINISEDCGEKEALSETHYEYGLMWKSKGEEEKAKEHLEKALSMFKDMGMRVGVDKTEEALSEIKV